MQTQYIAIPGELDYNHYKVIIVTGPRGVKEEVKNFQDRHTKKTNELVEDKMIRIVENPYIRAIIFGGAMGIDTIALYYALKWKVSDYPKLIVVVPNIIGNQPKETWEITKKADQIIEMKQSYKELGNQIYKNRNMKMFDIALQITRENKSEILLLAFWEYVTMYSGTYSTICTAKKLGIRSEIVDIRN